MTGSEVLALRPVAKQGGGLVRLTEGRADFRLTGVNAAVANVLIAGGQTLRAPLRRGIAAVALPRGASVLAAAVTRQGAVLLLGSARLSWQEALVWAQKSAHRRQQPQEDQANPKSAGSEQVLPMAAEQGEELGSRGEAADAPLENSKDAQGEGPGPLAETGLERTGPDGQKGLPRQTSAAQKENTEGDDAAKGLQEQPQDARQQGVASAIAQCCGPERENRGETAGLTAQEAEGGEESEGEESACACEVRGPGYVGFLRRVGQAAADAQEAGEAEAEPRERPDGASESQADAAPLPADQKERPTGAGGGGAGFPAAEPALSRRAFPGVEGEESAAFLPGQRHVRADRRMGILTNAFPREFPRQTWQVYTQPNGSHLLRCTVGGEGYYALPSEAGAAPPAYLPRDARYCTSRLGRGYWVFRG